MKEERYWAGWMMTSQCWQLPSKFLPLSASVTGNVKSDRLLHVQSLATNTSTMSTLHKHVFVFCKNMPWSSTCLCLYWKELGTKMQ